MYLCTDSPCCGVSVIGCSPRFPETVRGRSGPMSSTLATPCPLHDWELSQQKSLWRHGNQSLFVRGSARLTRRCVYVHVRTYVCVCTYMYASVGIHTYIRMYMCCVYLRTYVHMYVCLCTVCICVCALYCVGGCCVGDMVVCVCTYVC